jgi:Co/Zn/Cd efflux system component
MMSALTVTIITACAALISAVFGGFVTFRANERKIKAAIITANRQKWGETLRDLLAEMMSVAYSVAIVKRQITTVDPVAAVAADRVLLDKVEHFALVKNKIKLMLNPEKDDHRPLLDAVNSIYQHLGSREEFDVVDRLHEDIERVTEQAQILLRREWQRVKLGD